MSIYTMEKVLWDLHSDPEKIKHYKRDPEGFLGAYPLASDERSLLTEQHVREMADRGVSQMLLFVAWQDVNGGEASIPEYMKRMNTPAR
ncbi:MAG: hypothetical protein KUL87_09675 [Pseudomonas sp.]|nr:hypothetical protein [Pseudomonas sp.]